MNDRKKIPVTYTTFYANCKWLELERVSHEIATTSRLQKDLVVRVSTKFQAYPPLKCTYKNYNPVCDIFHLRFADSNV